MEFPGAVGFQVGCLCSRQITLLQQCLAEPVPALGIQILVVQTVGAFDALMEQGKSFGHAAFGGTERRQLNLQLWEVLLAEMPGHALQAATGPLGGGIGLTGGEEGGDIRIPSCHNARIARRFRKRRVPARRNGAQLDIGCKAN